MAVRKKFIGVVVLVIATIIVLLTFSLKLRGKGIEGLWEGVLKYPGFESRLVLIISSMCDGTLRANILRPDESNEELPVSRIVFGNSSGHLRITSDHGSFEGQLNSENTAIEGQWKQGRWSQPLTLRKVPDVVKPPRPQTPAPPYPYDVEDVTFVNSAAGAKLAGTLTLPRTGRPCPAVLLISGVGAHDRDYSILQHRPFLVLADHLTRGGIAVLRFDDRGVGDSTGDRSQATSADYAQDVLAGIQFLKGHLEIRIDQIGLIGHSEGGTIAALAAAQSPDVAFIVMMGSPGLPGKEYNIQFEESMGRTLGQSEETIAINRTLQERVLSVVIHENVGALAEAKLRRIYREISPTTPEAKVKAAIRRFLSPWFRFNLKHNPRTTLEEVKCPVLAIIGEKDVQVPPKGNLEAIHNALVRGGNDDYKVEELPGLNHFFQIASTGSPLEYGKIRETISPRVMKLIYSWIIEHTE